MNSLPHEDQTLLAKTPEEAIRQLGQPLMMFKPGMENLVAGIIMGFLLIAGGSVLLTSCLREALVNERNLPWFAEKGSSLSLFLFGAAIGLGLAVGGAFLMRWLKRLFSLRVLVCPAGFLCVSRKGVQVFPWDRLENVREIVTQEYFPLKGVARYAAPMGKSRSFVIRRQDGVEFAFDGNTVKKLNTLAKMIEEATSQRGIPWHVVQQ